MTNETFPIKVDGSLENSKLVTYIQENYDEILIDKRPLVLICPGGGYSYTSNREAEAFALQFLSMGYHAAVLRYSCAPAHYPTALEELATAMKIVKEHSDEWSVSKVFVLGCSAGGHLAASLGCFYASEELNASINTTPDTIRPDGMILCYPVITSGNFAHRGSFDNLLGDLSNNTEMLEKMSLENQVTNEFPPTFMWHTCEDTSVPLENSLLMFGALRAAGVPCEYHVYPHGSHGLGLANALTQKSDGGGIQEECTTWISLVQIWLKNQM